MRAGPSFSVRRSSSIWASTSEATSDAGTNAVVLGRSTRPNCTLLVPPVPPLVGGGPGDPHFGRHMGHRPSSFDAEHHRESAYRSEPGVSVHLSPPGSSVGV